MVDKTFRAGEKMPRIRTEVKNVTYLYNDGSDVAPDGLPRRSTRSRCPPIPSAEELRFMRENDTVQLLLVDGKPSARAAAGRRSSWR